MAVRVEGFAAEGRVGRANGPARLVLLIPPLILTAVIAFALFGRTGAPTADSIAAASPVVNVVAEAAPSNAAVEPDSSLRSDWPAAIDPHERVDPLLDDIRRPREEGTDGLMGRLPFGLAGDTPYPVAAAIDWSTIYDERKDWHADRPSPRSRLHATDNFRTDPYQG